MSLRSQKHLPPYLRPLLPRPDLTDLALRPAALILSSSPTTQQERWIAAGPNCVFDDYGTNPEWNNCVATLKQNLIAATCIAAMISTLGEI